MRRRLRQGYDVCVQRYSSSSYANVDIWRSYRRRWSSSASLDVDAFAVGPPCIPSATLNDIRSLPEFSVLCEHAKNGDIASIADTVTRVADITERMPYMHLVSLEVMASLEGTFRGNTPAEIEYRRAQIDIIESTCDTDDRISDFAPVVLNALIIAHLRTASSAELGSGRASVVDAALSRWNVSKSSGWMNHAATFEDSTCMAFHEMVGGHKRSIDDVERIESACKDAGKDILAELALLEFSFCDDGNAESRTEKMRAIADASDNDQISDAYAGYAFSNLFKTLPKKEDDRAATLLDSVSAFQHAEGLGINYYTSLLLLAAEELKKGNMLSAEGLYKTILDGMEISCKPPADAPVACALVYDQAARELAAYLEKSTVNDKPRTSSAAGRC